jgi:hypothetical protein
VERTPSEDRSLKLEAVVLAPPRDLLEMNEQVVFVRFVRVTGDPLPWYDQHCQSPARCVAINERAVKLVLIALRRRPHFVLDRK